MITPKAWKLHLEVKESASAIEKVEKSNAAYLELIENCKPTKEEFANFVTELSISPATLWDLIIKIPEWNKT